MTDYFQLFPFLQSYTVLICSIGLFGNVNLIIATCRRKSLRTKMGCLLMISTTSHTVCLLSELVSVALKLRFTEIHQDDCFRYVGIYTFAVLFQSTFFLMMAVDLFLAVMMPIRHKFWHREPYLVIVCTPPSLFSAFGVIMEKAYLSHDYLLFCTVPLAASKKVRFWGTVIIFCTTFLAVSLILITALNVHLAEQKMRKCHHHHLHPMKLTFKPKSSEIRLLKSLATLIFVFICSWCSSMVLVHVDLYLNKDVEYVVHKYTESF